MFRLSSFLLHFSLPLCHFWMLASACVIDCFKCKVSQHIHMYLYFFVSTYIVYLSLSLDLFLPDDVTALTCPLDASYLGYLKKCQRLLHCSQGVQILNQLFMLNPSWLDSFCHDSFYHLCLYLFVLYNNLWLCVTYIHVLPCACLLFYVSPVMAERSALLVKMFFIPSSCRVLLRSIFCSTLNLNKAVKKVNILSSGN